MCQALNKTCEAKVILQPTDNMCEANRMTFKQAREWSHEHNMTIRRKFITGEWRVNFSRFWGGTEDTAYYADSLDDAVNTMKIMYEHRLNSGK